MIGRLLAIQQCEEPAGISHQHKRYRDGLALWSVDALLTLSLGSVPLYASGYAVQYARKLIALRKRANRRRMAQGLAPWCVLCGAECHFDNNDNARHTAGSDSTHKARV